MHLPAMLPATWEPCPEPSSLSSAYATYWITFGRSGYVTGCEELDRGVSVASGVRKKQDNSSIPVSASPTTWPSPVKPKLVNVSTLAVPLWVIPRAKSLKGRNLECSTNTVTLSAEWDDDM